MAQNASFITSVNSWRQMLSIDGSSLTTSQLHDGTWYTFSRSCTLTSDLFPGLGICRVILPVTRGPYSKPQTLVNHMVTRVDGWSTAVPTAPFCLSLSVQVLLKAVHPLPGGKTSSHSVFCFFNSVASHGLEEHIKHHPESLERRSYWFLANRPCRVKCCALPRIALIC